MCRFYRADLFARHFPLRPARAHEVTGSGATGFAAISCRLGAKGAIWLAEGWQPETLNPVGLAPYCDTAKLILGRTRTITDTLACAEESLRRVRYLLWWPN